uniref:C2H2-type domain-containing protein n=1 Tax=Megaselia scalaris TaxID=36166 RepID=T1G9Z0_MEGSC
MEFSENEESENMEIKMFKCKFCPEEFSKAEDLGSHSKQHLNFSKEFQCSICSKLFNSKATLERHERIHTGERLFQCRSEDDLRFGNSSNVSQGTYRIIDDEIVPGEDTVESTSQPKAKQNEIQPTTTTLPLCGNTNFLPPDLQCLTNFVQLFSWEWSISNTSCVGFYNSNNITDCLWGQSKTSQTSTNTAITAGHIWISTKINVQHSSVGSFNQDSLVLLKTVVQKAHCLSDIWTQFFGKNFVSVDLGINVDIQIREQAFVSSSNCGQLFSKQIKVHK